MTYEDLVKEKISNDSEIKRLRAEQVSLREQANKKAGPSYNGWSWIPEGQPGHEELLRWNKLSSEIDRRKHALKETLRIIPTTKEGINEALKEARTAFDGEWEDQLLGELNRLRRIELGDIGSFPASQPPLIECEDDIPCTEDDDPPKARDCTVDGVAGTQTATCIGGKWVWGDCVPLGADDDGGSGGGGDNTDHAIGLMTRYLFNSNLSDSEFTENDFYESYTKSVSWENIKKPNVSDPLRAATGRFWNLSNNKKNITFLKNRLTQSPFKLSFSSTRVLWISPNKNISLYGDSGLAFNTFRNLIKGWKKEVNGKWFYDHCFSSKIPVSKRAAENVQVDASVKQYDIRLNYNFYMSQYENILQQTEEQLLPNLYVMESAMQFEPNANRPDLTLNPKFEQHLTLNGAIELNGPISDMAGEYFDIYSRSVNGVTGEGELIDSFSNIFVSHSNVNLLSNYNNKKELFPMHVDIEFSTDTRTKFSELLKDTDMSCVLMKNIATEPAVNLEPFEEFIESTGAPVIHDDNPLNRRYVDITDWFDGMLNIEEEAPEDFKGVFLGTKREMIDDANSQIQRIISSIILNGKLKKLKDSNTRTLEEVMNGKLASSETVMYRIQKILNGKTIQNFYLPNSNDIDVHKFVDTQVKYGKEYRYVIYAWELVYGTKYKYTMPSVGIRDKNGIYAEIKVKPDVRIFEIPYASYINTLLDSPSIEPNVEIIPFRGVNNKIKIHLSPNVGSYDMEPVFFDSSEIDSVEKLMTSQHRVLFLDPMHYQTDDHAAMYEVYRIDHHPYSYLDFAGSRIKQLNTDVELDVPGSATSAALIDSILPNRKYWYTFRSLDNHDNFSYPTPVYQVEIVDDNGVIYPLIKVVDFKKVDDKTLLKSFKRMMHVEPATVHTLLPEALEELDTVADKWDKPTHFKLGVSEDDLWGKKFKIRLTSKKTGKKIDMNVEFKNKHLINEPE